MSVFACAFDGASLCVCVCLYMCVCVAARVRACVRVWVCAVSGSSR